MHKMAIHLTDYFIRNQIITSDLWEEHVYGFEILFGKIINYITLFVLAYMGGNLIQMLLFMIIFFSLRSRTGGYHCKSAFMCYVSTFVIYALVTNVITPLFCKNTDMMILIMFISVIIIYTFAPVNHPNLELDKEEIKHCKGSSRWLAVVIGIGILVFMWLHIMPDKIVYVTAGISIDAGLLVIAKILGQEIKENEKTKKETFKSSIKKSYETVCK